MALNDDHEFRKTSNAKRCVVCNGPIGITWFEVDGTLLCSAVCREKYLKAYPRLKCPYNIEKDCGPWCAAFQMRIRLQVTAEWDTCQRRYDYFYREVPVLAAHCGNGNFWIGLRVAEDMIKVWDDGKKSPTLDKFRRPED
jgi:hypothetical protein